MSQQKKHRRELPCEVCGAVVEIRGRDRFLAAVRAGEYVRCEGCRAFVSPGIVRVTELPTEQEKPSLGLARKQRRNGRRKGVLESMPLKRCGRVS